MFIEKLILNVVYTFLMQQADLKFALGLVNLVRGVKNAVKTHQDLTGADRSTAELITGVFTGIEVS